MSCATELNQPRPARSPFRGRAVAAAGPPGSTILSAVSKSHSASPAKCFSASAAGKALPAPPGRAVIIAGPGLGDWRPPDAPSVLAEPLLPDGGSLPEIDVAGSTASALSFDGSTRLCDSLTLSAATLGESSGRPKLPPRARVSVVRPEPYLAPVLHVNGRSRETVLLALDTVICNHERDFASW